MKVYELVNSCQNQWKGYTFKRNENFLLEITNGNRTYILSANYCETNSWLDLRDREVGYWFMKYDNEYNDYTLKIRVNA